MKTNKPSDCPECDQSKSTRVKDSRMAAASTASRGNLGESLGASFSIAVGPDVGPKIGGRLGSMPIDSVMGIIETPGSTKQKKKLTSNQKKEHVMRSVGTGNFSLNAQYEQGLIGSVVSAKSASKKSLEASDIGPALSAASAVGIGIPKADMLGMGSNDNPMFKILKLAAFGIRALCAALRGKTRGGPGGYGSRTEEKLGILLSIGIDLGIFGDLLGRLKSIFDGLRGLKGNFGSVSKKDLNLAGLLATLCDWIENMEFGSSLVDSFRDDTNKHMTNKTLTKLLGDKFIGAGTYDSYARNDFSFDQQYKSLVGDLDSLKCAGCKKGSASVTLTQGQTNLAKLEFDPLTGLMRQRGTETPQPTTTTVATTKLKDIQYQTDESNIKYVTPSLAKKTEGISDNLTKTMANLDESPKLDKTTPVPQLQTLGVADNLNVPALAGDDTLYVNDNSQFPQGSWVVLGEGTPGAECVNVDGYGSLKLATPLVNSHPENTTLSPPSTNEPDMCQKFPSTPYAPKPSSLKSTLAPKPPISETEISKIIGGGAVPQSSSLTPDLSWSGDTRSLESHTTEGIKYNVADGSAIVYDTYQETNSDGSLGDFKKDTWSVPSDGSKSTLLTTETTIPRPFGGSPVSADATSVKSYWTGEEITSAELEGTHLEGEDLNKIAVLDKEDLETLKDTKKMNKSLATAEKEYDKVFAEEIEKTENLVLSEQSDGIIFGAQLPTLNGNQIVINSERVLIQSKTQETGIFAKRKFFVTTDDEITMNAKQRIVLKTDMHTSIESPTVHLGVYTTRNHPTLKGDCTVWWLQDLCDWLSSHCHSDPHITTGSPVQQGSLAALRARLPTLLSERIFISG